MENQQQQQQKAKPSKLKSFIIAFCMLWFIGWGLQHCESNKSTQVIPLALRHTRSHVKAIAVTQ